ncbi:1-phosphofructokinase family hexose kinase [Williamsia sp.]|uniref:1-phosphofructokinase family hexose kinase n=1 Tax=Williamsia sp. TaxID=1872085 RepID=UPI001A29B86F|nr:1-phosphofructokinase family hexose kinase [Williamsia sp.]MBJ7288424.1 1-phosphofructokinase family hexose kinase [Williamsia sp.]
MIVTVTANPSVDRTVTLPGPLVRGSVTRALASRAEPGGKGVNVSRAVQMAGVATTALLPARSGDPLLSGLDAVGLRYRTVDVAADVRSNLTVTEPDGTTTKLNLPGNPMTPADLSALTTLIVESAATATWVALCGSLPPGVPDSWYADLASLLAPLSCRVAVDTSGAPLHAIRAAMPDVAVDLIKPNVEELCEMTGADLELLERSADAGDFGPTLDTARSLQQLAGCAVLATLGAAGALLVTAEGGWLATPPPIVPVSTVGAGDATLAGYLLATGDEATPAERLRRAVAYGSAAAALAGTQPPTPSDLALAAVHVSEVATHAV